MKNQLVVTFGDVRSTFGPETRVVLGRSTAADVRIDDAAVSGTHAVAEHDGQQWSITDQSSSNGTFLDGQPVDRRTIAERTRLTLGGPDGVEVMLDVVLSPDRATAAEARHPAEAGADREPGRRPAGDRLRVGRAPDNDVVVDDLLVSRYHAEVRVASGAARIVDLGSANGVFVNGAQVQEQRLAAGDLVSIGGQSLTWSGSGLLALPEEQAPSFRAEHLSVKTKSGVTLLDDVSLALAPRSLLAVIGPSGAGKTTLLGALTGLRPAGSGVVRWNKRDLYANYDQLRRRIGLVPQEDILHPQLTVRRALGYAARLRFPSDTSAQERAERVEQVLAEVGLTDRGDLRIDKLSGGQRKRTSVALELLTAPPLIFLDEPTSGLDPGLDRQVMTLLRELADAGRTVVVVTHSVLNLDVCDRVLLVAPGGRTAYFGPPGQMLGFFGVADHSSVFLEIEKNSTEWPQRYAASPFAARYAGSVAGQPSVSASTSLAQPQKARSRPGRVRQFLTLCRRYVAVIGADRQYVALLLGMPLVLALLAHAVPGHLGLTQGVGLGGTEAQQRLIVLIIAGALVGTGMSVRELVKERAIYRRERSVGLSPGAYLLSKFAVLGVLTGLQATVFAFLALWKVAAPPDPLVLPSGRLEIVVACVAMTIASMVYGLILSSLVGEPEQTMPLLVLVVMGQLILCGGLVPTAGRAGLEQLSWLAPSHWSYSAGSATVGLLTQPDPTRGPDWSARHQQWSWIADLGILGGLSLAGLVLVAWLLARSVRRRPLA